MKIGYYCPLVGEDFFKKFCIESVDLRSIAYQSGALDFYQSSSNKCGLACQMSGLIQNNDSLDGVILTNCCHEQEQLVDFLAHSDKLMVFKLNIPRNRSMASVEFLANQLTELVQQLGGKYVGEECENLSEPKQQQVELNERFLPVMYFGISVPPWLDGLLKEYGLLPLVRSGCGIISEKQKKMMTDFNAIYRFAEDAVLHSFCIRSTFQDSRFSILEGDNSLQQQSAVLFISLEYCTASTYGFAKIKEFFEEKKIPVFKIVISNWNEPSAKTITQIESIAHICKENQEK